MGASKHRISTKMVNSDTETAPANRTIVNNSTSSPATTTTAAPNTTTDSNGSSSSSTTTTTTDPVPLIGPYIPGSGPPLPKIWPRQPDNKTTGYVIDRLFLPRRLPHFAPGETHVVAVYYVGYRDRPRARALVPYAEILQHVSLRELEEWEDGLEAMRAENYREDAEARRREAGEERRRLAERGVTTGRVTRGMRRRMGVDVDELAGMVRDM